MKYRESLLNTIEALKDHTILGTSYYYHVHNLLGSYKRELEELDSIELYGIK